MRNKLYNHIYQNNKLNANRTHSYYIQKHFPAVYNILYENNMNEHNFKEKLYRYLYNIKETPKCNCSDCNNKVKFTKFSKGYLTYCSYKCAYKNFGNNEKTINKISLYQKKIRNEKLLETYKDFNIQIENDNIIIINYCQHGDLNISINDFKRKVNKKPQTFCKKCYDFYIKRWVPNEKDYEEQNKLLLEFKKDTIYNICEERIKKYFPILYKCIISFTNNDYSWSEKIYAFSNKIKERPLCINCKINHVHFLSSAHRYSYHCKICCDNGDLIVQYKKDRYKKETKLYEYVKSIYNGKIIRNRRYKIYNSQQNSFEIDIFLVDLNIGIEFNGLHWHDENTKYKNYHYDKWNFFKNKGIKLLSFWEDTWDYNPEIIKSIIKNKIKANKNKIYARKCVIKEINSNENKNFCRQNHLQGYASALIKLGLFYNNELLSVMTFGKPRFNKKYEYELLRFCSKLNINVVGGASKLFKYFIRNYNPSNIIIYVNCEISDGNLYKILGFKEIGHTNISYWWYKSKIRESRYKYEKRKLIKNGFNPKSTENIIMKERGFSKIYGLGNLKYEWIKTI